MQEGVAMQREDALTRALGCARGVLEGVGPADLTKPTPCPDWTARQLLNHLLGRLRYMESCLTATSVPNTPGPGELPLRDLIGADPLGAFEEVTGAVRLAARERAASIDETTAGVGMAEVLVHTWDLAVATGQSPRFNDDLARYCLSVMRAYLAGPKRNQQFAPPVAVASPASPMAELVALCGRAP